MAKLKALILAGGEGKRFAPVSTADLPKQFLAITDTNKSLIQKTYDRLLLLFEPKDIWIVSHQRYQELIFEHLPSHPKQNTILEPIKKNTAPALVWAMSHMDPDDCFLICPADHYIHDNQQAALIFKKGIEWALNNPGLVTFAVKPSFASTDYGYLECSENLNPNQIFKVLRFVEKPNLELAKKYIKAGNFFWNAGIFAWRVKHFFDALEKWANSIYQLTLENLKEIDFFNFAPAISIDYALMEKADCVYSLALDVGWSDVGTWEALDKLIKTYPIKPADEINTILKEKNDI